MNTISNEFLKFLRAGALFWSGYFLLLAIIDALRSEPGSLSAPYLLFYGATILLVLIPAFLPGLPQRLGKAYPALLLLLMGFLPFLGEAVVLPRFDVEPWVNVLASSDIYIRQWLPVALVAVLLAYGYGEREILLFVGAITGLNLAVALLNPSPEVRSTAALLSLLFGAFTAVVALGLNRAFRYMRQQQEALENANRQLLELAAASADLAVSRERNRMARDLHDTLAHSLTGLIIQLETVEAYWDKDPMMARDLLEQAIGTTRTGLQETRRALKALRASPLEDLGLILALKDLSETAAQRGSLELSLRLPQQLPQLSAKTEQCIYRVAQEATSNVAQHAEARRLDLWLTQTNGRITFNVHDDGVGFDPATISHPGHYGIPGMVERARLAGGCLTVHSHPGQGTTISLDLPIHQR